MSLFGTSPTDPASTSKQSLFDDDAPIAAKPGSGLFSDENSTPDVWSLPTPKKQARSSLVKTLLPAGEVPESYIDTFDALVRSGEGARNGVSLSGVRTLLNGSGLSLDEQSHILKIVLPDTAEPLNTGIDRGQFNVLLALIGLAQEKEDVTLDGVDERRRRLPRPSLPAISPNATRTSQGSQPEEPPVATKEPPATPTTRSRMRKQSFGVPDADPWGSPAQNRTNYSYNTASNGNTNNNNTSNSGLMRSTSTITTAVDPQPPKGHLSAAAQPANSSGSEWGGSYTSGSVPDFTTPGLGEGGFGGPGDDEGDDPSASRLGRSIGINQSVNNGVEESVVVTALQEKEGVFLFQYRNYQLSSKRRNSTVIRRYSDFVWLLDCLHKRYPFRQLPLLPPKRVAINGKHLAADNLFIEKRRRGLSRFANALVRHPVLSTEQLVVMFLTVPTELGVWRKQATIQVQEEFAGKPLPPRLEDSLPADLEETFDTVRNGVRRSAELYISQCALFERLIKRNEGVAADSARLAQSLHSLSEVSAQTYHIDTNDVPLLNEGLLATARHLTTSQALLEDEARAWDAGVLEDLKRQRDCLVSMRELFERRDRFARDSIPALEKRIATNEAKLAGVRAKPERKEGEAEKLEAAIVKDKESIVAQHARGVLIKECVRDELRVFHASQYHVARLAQDWAAERVKYAELHADNWRACADEVMAMPGGGEG